jgi:thiamine phosphate synthase YjbQ (UPF0047 family)
MAAHFRTLLAGHDLTIPMRDGRLLLGTWQGIFLTPEKWLKDRTPEKMV